MFTWADTLMAELIQLNQLMTTIKWLNIWLIIIINIIIIIIIKRYLRLLEITSTRNAHCFKWKTKPNWGTPINKDKYNLCD